MRAQHFLYFINRIKPPTLSVASAAFSFEVMVQSLLIYCLALLHCVCGSVPFGPGVAMQYYT